MRNGRIAIISVLLFLIISLGCIAQEEAPVQVETLAPTTTPAPTTTAPPTTMAALTTTPPTTTPAPTTTPPTTTPAPTTTAPPTTTPAPTTTAPPPKPTLEILNQQETYGPGGEVYVNGEVKNNWDKEVYEVQVSATFYDKYGNVLVILKSSPIGKLMPGASQSFIIRTEYPKETVDHYTLEASSPTITTATTPPPTTVAPKTELEIISQYEELTPGGKLIVKGVIKNIGDRDLFSVQVSAAFYDKYGEVLEEIKSLPITKLSPDETHSFSIESNYPKTNIASYKLEAMSQ